MRNVRWIVNGASLLAICAGAFLPAPAKAADATAPGGTCCAQAGAICVIFGPDGRTVTITNAYFKDNPPCPVAQPAEPVEPAEEAEPVVLP